jgi:hypothetical protein
MNSGRDDIRPVPFFVTWQRLQAPHNMCLDLEVVVKSLFDANPTLSQITLLQGGLAVK